MTGELDSIGDKKKKVFED